MQPINHAPWRSGKWPLCLAAAILVLMATACSRPSTPTGLRIMPTGKQFSGFLSDYAKLTPNPQFENTLSYVRGDPAKNIHKYVAIIIDPVVVYVATDKAARDLPDRGRTALTNYFQQAIARAVSSAFPVVQDSGPLVLRLRSALIGIDVGDAPPQESNAAGGETLSRTVNIGKVEVEMELVDSETGEQIAAAVDKQNLGEATAIGSVHFSRDEKYREAVRAFNGWAARLRDFLDSAHELSDEDVARNEANQQAYANEK